MRLLGVLQCTSKYDRIHKGQKAIDISYFEVQSSCNTGRVVRHSCISAL